MYQHQGQGTEWGCVSAIDRAQRRWGCVSAPRTEHRVRVYVSTRDRAQSGAVSAPRTGAQRRWGVSAPWTGHRGGGGVSAPWTGHTEAAGVSRHQGQGTGWGVGVVSASGTGHTVGVYRHQRQGAQGCIRRHVGMSLNPARCSGQQAWVTAAPQLLSAAARDSGLAVCRAWTPAQPCGWRCPECSSRCGSQACPIPPASQSLTSASVFSS